MDKKRLIEKTLATFNDIVENYKDRDEEIVLNYSAKLEKFAKEFEKKSERMIDKNRKLRVGIVGQIKVGKSSFLNSLLFDSQAKLPQAATPMTAALTLISYAEKPKAEVEFYTQEDWNKIKNKADKAKEKLEKAKRELESGNDSLIRKEPTLDEIERTANLPQEEKAAKELIDMVQKRSLNLASYLGQKKEIALEELKNYVGAAGQYTPLVKSSHLYINDEGIKNIEVVDTPGMNDPIISRGERTREYLGHCDVVFLLSYAGQFLDSSDIRVLHQNLPQEGIKDVVILGTKIDSALMGIGYDYDGDLHRALVNLEDNLKSHAQDTIAPMLSQEPENQILQSLKESLPPKFISAMCYDIAVKFCKLNEEQEFILDRLDTIFDFDFTPELLKDLANIDSIKEEEFSRIRKNKEQILAERFSNFLPGQTNKLKNILKNLEAKIKDRIDELENADLAQLNKREEDIKKSIRNTEGEINDFFDNISIKLKKDFTKLKTEVYKLARSYEGIKVEKDTETKSREVEKDGFLNGIKRFFGSSGGYRTENYTVTNKYANVYDAVEKVKKLVSELEDEIRFEIEKAINFSQFRNDLITTVKNNFDLSNPNFELKHILNPVERTIEEIKIPDVYFDDNKYRKMITDQFSSEKVEGDDEIYRLRNLQKDVISNVLQDMREEISLQMENIIENLEEAGANFSESVLTNSKSQIEEIRNGISNKEEELANIKSKYNKLLSQIREDINTVNKII